MELLTKKPSAPPAGVCAPSERTALQRAALALRRHRSIYIMLIPVVLYYIIFQYGPMYGLIIAFKNYNPRLGFLGSPWAGLENFRQFFSSVYFWRVLRNTLTINVMGLLLGFPFPIVFALLLNEIRCSLFKRTVQTVTYLPHFISLVVICGMILDFFSTNGLINNIRAVFGLSSITFFTDPKYFQPIYVLSDIWQGFGWNSIIFLSALSAIDPTLYEAARIDGASRWQQALRVTLPGIAPTIIIMLILQVGKTLNISSQKIILLYNESIYETSDVISSFVYRYGLQQSNYSYSTAVGMFNSVINFILLLSVNKISDKVSETSLW